MVTIASSSESIFSETLYVRRFDQAAVVVPVERRPLSPAQQEIDVRLLKILDAPVADGMTALVGFHQKEIQFFGVLCGITVLESRDLHFRLANPRDSDELATKFKRLTSERRGRILNYLADARRRAALAAR